MEELNRIRVSIIDAVVCVHIHLGPGLSEEVYKQCLLIELKKRNLEVKSEVYLPVVYDEKLIPRDFSN
jgi:GxxExxY protein